MFFLQWLNNITKINQNAQINTQHDIKALKRRKKV